MQSGISLVAESSKFADVDDWDLPAVFDKDEVEITETIHQRGLCANELDITSSATDFDWSVPSDRA